MFSECKIFFGENILRKGKYFLSFDCIVEIIPENYLLCLVLHVKNLFLEKVNTSHPPPPPNTQNPDWEEEKNYTTTPLPPKHHHSHHHHNNKIKNQRNRKSITKISEGGGGFGSGLREKVRREGEDHCGVVLLGVCCGGAMKAPPCRIKEKKRGRVRPIQIENAVSESGREGVVPQ